MLRNSSDQALIVREAVTNDDHTLVGDDIFADVLAVIAAAHFDHDHDLAKLAVDVYITQPDNVIGEKRNRVVLNGNSVKESSTSTVLRIVTPTPVNAPIIR